MTNNQEPLNGAQLQTLQNGFNAKLLEIRADVELRKRALDMAVESASKTVPIDGKGTNIIELARQMHKFLIEATNDKG